MVAAQKDQDMAQADTHFFSFLGFWASFKPR